jgi:hypothetical protein
MTKALKKQLDTALKNYIYKFEKAHGVEFEWAVNDDLMGVLCFGDHMFNMSDIVYDVDNKLPVKLIFEWQDASLDAQITSDKDQINLQSYAEGLRYS